MQHRNLYLHVYQAHSRVAMNEPARTGSLIALFPVTARKAVWDCFIENNAVARYRVKFILKNDWNILKYAKMTGFFPVFSYFDHILGSSKLDFSGITMITPRWKLKVSVSLNLEKTISDFFQPFVFSSTVFSLRYTALAFVSRYDRVTFTCLVGA